MKNLKMIVLASALVMGSATVSAEQYFSGGQFKVRNFPAVVQVDSASTKERAYQTAKVKLKSLKSGSNLDLQKEFNIGGAQFKRDSFHLKDAYITVDERMNEHGNIEFVGKIHMDSHALVVDR